MLQARFRITHMHTSNVVSFDPCRQALSSWLDSYELRIILVCQVFVYSFILA
jgi:hypothetical protein